MGRCAGLRIYQMHVYKCTVVDGVVSARYQAHSCTLLNAPHLNSGSGGGGNIHQAEPDCLSMLVVGIACLFRAERADVFLPIACMSVVHSCAWRTLQLC